MNNTLSATSALLPCVIAQMPAASGSQVLTVLLGGAALVVIANQVLTFWKRINPGEQPVPAQTYVPIATCEKLHRAADADAVLRRKELLGEIMGIRTLIENWRRDEEERARKSHERINQLSDRVYKIDGTVENHIEHGGHTK